MKPDNIIATRPNKIIYREGSTAVKLFEEGYSLADILNEAHNHAIVEETGFPIPPLEGVNKIDGRWAIITRFIEGKTLAQMMEETPEKADACLARMVEVQLAMHGYSAGKLRHLTDKMYERIGLSGLSHSVQFELHARLGSLPKHLKLCHGDMNPGNIVITEDGKAFVLDWAHATQGNASADAARTYLLFKLQGQDQRAEKYMALFCEKTGCDPDYVQKWLPIVAASHLVKGQPVEREFLVRWTNVVAY
ncbi:MAG: aminoglycoside phosphotransferase family protein [Alistipes senegalensis]|nr:aminoglycoside phosphotransferase family protein [Oxalobacter formigenes]MCM1280728.1 aminoglycoside phosphotransferase family protein [Alistipes senegalensis]